MKHFGNRTFPWCFQKLKDPPAAFSDYQVGVALIAYSHCMGLGLGLVLGTGLELRLVQGTGPAQ